MSSEQPDSLKATNLISVAHKDHFFLVSSQFSTDTACTGQRGRQPYPDENCLVENKLAILSKKIYGLSSGKELRFLR